MIKCQHLGNLGEEYVGILCTISSQLFINFEIMSKLKVKQNSLEKEKLSN